MRFLLYFITAVLLIVSCKSKDNKQAGAETLVNENKNKGDSSLLTDQSWGWIDSSTDIEGLKKLYGEANIKDDSICGAECEDTVAVTFVYRNSNKEFIVYWNDSAYHKEISFIRCYTAGSPYHTANGVRLGLTLNELLKINGKPVSFSGFGWDYGGGIISLNGGALEKSSIRFNLDLPDDPVGDNAVYGDTNLDSDMPAVKKLLDKILVSELFLSFNARTPNEY